MKEGSPMSRRVRILITVHPAFDTRKEAKGLAVALGRSFGDNHDETFGKTEGERC